jgi:hypothetical protein
MARRMGQRHEDLARPAAGDSNVILHYGITAGKTVFEPQPFEKSASPYPFASAAPSYRLLRSRR